MPSCADLACPLFAAVHPAFPLPTKALLTPQSALMDGLGEAVVACDLSIPCEFPPLGSCQNKVPVDPLLGSWSCSVQSVQMARPSIRHVRTKSQSPITERSTLSSKPHFPLLRSHKLSIWPPCCTVSTGRMHDDLSLNSAFKWQFVVVLVLCFFVVVVVVVVFYTAPFDYSWYRFSSMNNTYYLFWRLCLEITTVFRSSPRGLAFMRWGCCCLCLWHKSTEIAHSFLLCSCVSVCLYSPFNCISFCKFSRQPSASSLCSSGLISALLVLSTMYLSMKVSFSPDVILYGWLGLKHQLTN